MYCCYYQATVKKETAWFFVAILRSFEHVAFDRTIDKSCSLFEFFVPEAMEKTFLAMMAKLGERDLFSGLVKKPNRLEDPNETL